MDKSERKHTLAWDDDAFCARAAAIAKKQGRTIEEVCLTAGLAHDTLNKKVSRGRNISTIFALANALHVPPYALMFEDTGTDSPPLDSASLRRLALVAHVAAHLYVSLDDHQRPRNQEIERVLGVVMSLIDTVPKPPVPPEPPAPNPKP